MIYSVVSKEIGDDSGTTVHQDYHFAGMVSRASHLVEIMENLEFLGLELISITVKGE